MHAVGPVATRRCRRGPALPAALLACALASTAPGQDLEPGLAPPLVDEVNAFTIQLPAHMVPGPSRARWLKRTFEHVHPDKSREVVAVGLVGPHEEVLPFFDWLKRAWGESGFIPVSERRVPDPAQGDQAHIVFEREREADVCHLRFFQAAGGWVFVLGLQYPKHAAAQWKPWLTSITRSFRILGEPINTNVMPELGISRVERPDLGLSLLMPLHSEPSMAELKSTWIRAVFTCPTGDKAACEISLGYSEAGEPFDDFCRFVRGEFERLNLRFDRDVAAKVRPAAAGAAYIFMDPGVQTSHRVYLCAQASWTLAVGFRFVGATHERERNWFCKAFIEAIGVTGTPTVLAPRAPKLTLAMAALQRDHPLGIEYCVPVAAQPGAVTDARIKLVFTVTHADQSTGTIHVSEAVAGESLPEFIRAMDRVYRQAGAEPVGQRTAAPPELGAAAYLRMDATATAMVYHLYFFQQAERTFCVSFSFKAGFEELWRSLEPPVLLAFRVIRVPEIWAEPPPAAQADEGEGTRLLSAAVGLAGRARKLAQDDLAAGIAAMRKLTGGPAPTGRITAHLFTDARPLQRVWGAADAPPPAFYFPPARLVLARGDKEGVTDEAGAARRAAAARAYGDDRFGTPHGLPPWIRVGLDEAARAARLAGKADVDVAMRHSPLAKWARANKRKVSWPDVDVVVRKCRALDGEADRAYALALVLAAEASTDPAIHGVLRRFADTLAETRRPADALEAALRGVDLPAWDKAALAILDRA